MGSISFTPKTLLALLILAYCTFNSREMFDSWLFAPYERMSWLLFLIWVLPLLVFLYLKWTGKESSPLKINSLFLWGALLSTLVGIIGTVNAANYIGLALALASFMPWNWLVPIWVVGALSWMPAIGWIGSHFFPEHVFLFRLLIAIIASLAGFHYLHRT